jgi:hypothetical protein
MSRRLLLAAKEVIIEQIDMQAGRVSDYLKNISTLPFAPLLSVGTLTVRNLRPTDLEYLLKHVLMGTQKLNLVNCLHDTRTPQKSDVYFPIVYSEDLLDAALRVLSHLQ